MRSLVLGVASFAAVACGKVESADPDGSTGDDDAQPAFDAATCTPSTTECTGGHIVTCDASGMVTEDIACPLGCMAGTTTCSQMEVSNGLTRYIQIAADSGVDLVIPTGTSTIKASDGTFMVNNVQQPLASEVTNGMRVIPVRSLRVTGQLTAIKAYTELDAPALVFVVAGDVTINGPIDLSADRNLPPPGALDYEASQAAGCVGGDGGAD
ncbi:MAG: hypothetical protein K8M05_17830, partial [Deltaproteobacteria bacterium]|nr:hypothetical protein [Kofleriaceae bacterium]